MDEEEKYFNYWQFMKVSFGLELSAFEQGEATLDEWKMAIETAYFLFKKESEE